MKGRGRRLTKNEEKRGEKEGKFGRGAEIGGKFKRDKQQKLRKRKEDVS